MKPITEIKGEEVIRELFKSSSKVIFAARGEAFEVLQ